MSAAIDTFEIAVLEALDGGKIGIAVRNAARAELLSLLRQLAAYVQGHCGADLVNLLGSGFDPVKAPTPVGVLPAPQNPRLGLTGKSGQLLFRFVRLTNAVNYSVQISNQPEGPWNDRGLSSKAKVLLDGLTPGDVYWARARANGSAGSGDWSKQATAMVI